MEMTGFWSASDSAMTTVVVPTFNGERLLRATLDSLAAQTLAPDEVIVVDDGSSDDTLAVARSHEVVSQVIQQPNCGVAVARNQGLSAARNPWVAFVDQDDIWHRSRLSALHELGRVS